MNPIQPRTTQPGWYSFAFTGDAASETPAFRQDYEAKYGLFGIDFLSPSGHNVVDYNGWLVRACGIGWVVGWLVSVGLSTEWALV